MDHITIILKGVCEFIPNEVQPNDRLGSVLFSQKINSVNQYCDNDKSM